MKRRRELMKQKCTLFRFRQGEEKCLGDKEAKTGVFMYGA